MNDNQTSLHILIVEDNPGDARLIRAHLAKAKEQNFQAQVVANLNDALQALDQKTYAAVLLDLFLPDSDGITTLETVLSKTNWTPVIVLTGLEDEAAALSAVQTGAQDYLFKGQINSQLLLRTIHYAIERKQAERTRSEQEAFYHAVFDRALVGIAITANGRVIFCNPCEARFFGYENPANLFGRKLSELISPEDQAEFESISAGIFAGQDMDEPVIFHARRTDGTPITLESLAMRFRYEGKDGLLYFHLDVTDRDLADEVQRLSDERFRLLTENANDLIWTVNLDMKPTYVSPAIKRLLGYSVDEAMKLSMQQLFTPPSFERVMDDLEEALVQDQHAAIIQSPARILELEMVHKKDYPVSVEVNFSLLRPAPKEPAHGIIAIARNISERLRQEKELIATKDELARNVSDLKILTDMISRLQLTEDEEEAYGEIRESMEKLFAGLNGVLYVMNEKEKVLEQRVAWGPNPPPDGYYTQKDCWALRLGDVHRVSGKSSARRCRHINKQSPPESYLCVPVKTANQIFGLLHLSSPEGSSPVSSIHETIASTTAKQVGLSLANLALRRSLREQSIHDPLTGLFNRLYMEETLRRELYRAGRENQPLSVILMDIDHFKKFNDTYGHLAGDALLRALGKALFEEVRTSDVVCRYGGEEFIIILPGVSFDAAFERAENIRQHVRQMSIQYENMALSVTISAGVACFPAFGPSSDELIRAADEALYRAKLEGRDRVMRA